MPTNLIFFVILFAFTLLILTIFLLRKDKITVKYSLIWIFASIGMIIISFLPNFMLQLANLFGFELLSNMVLCMFIGVLLLITLALTVMVTGLKKRTTLLIQEISLLKKELEDKK